MGSVKMILGLFVMVAAFYVSAKLVPPYFDNYQFTDAVKDEATRDSYSTKTEDEIRRAIFIKAPSPHLTSSITTSLPSANFLLMIEAEISGMLSIVAVTSRRA